ncbi:MAG: hypothetical protein QOJ99_4528, partial [Bryobacterales bacterium]|nr:hypothetical protein [Bryobacterales bacterium]
WPHQLSRASELMVSRSRPILFETPVLLHILPPQSPLGKTPHKAGNGVLSITCRNRHCPRCQSAAREQWLAERAKELLPVPCHVVFTIPQQLAPVTLQNQRVCYGLLFRAVSETLQEIAAEFPRLRAKSGFLAVLHTWSQQLVHHPHVHCVMPAGGLSFDGSRWVDCHPKFFLPVQLLSSRFRKKLLALLRQAFADGKLEFLGQSADLAEPARFDAWLEKSKKTKWVVHAKPPFGGAGGGFEIPCPLYAPRGDLQQSAAVAGERPGHLPVARLPTRQPVRNHDTGSGRVHPALPAAHPAVRVCEDPPFRIPGQPQSRIRT